MYKLITRLNLIECEDCGESVLVTDEQLVNLIYDGEIVLDELEEECDCEFCEFCRN